MVHAEERTKQRKKKWKKLLNVMTDEADATVEKKKRFFCFLFFHVSIKCARGGREVMDFTSSTVV